MEARGSRDVEESRMAEDGCVFGGRNEGKRLDHMLPLLQYKQGIAVPTRAEPTD